MIQSHYKKANIAAGIWALSMVTFMAVLNYFEGNIWDQGQAILIILFSVYAISLIMALWYYAKAKGYWGIFGAMLFFLSFAGLLLLLVLPDKRKNEAVNDT